MTVSCPDCRSVFRVDPSKVPATGVRARCSVCGGIIVVSGGTGPMRTPVRTPVPAVSSFPTAPPMTAPLRPGTRTPSLATGSVPPPPSAITPRMATPAAAPGRIARMTPPVSPSAGPPPSVAAPFAPTPVPAVALTAAPAVVLTPAPVVAAAAPIAAPVGTPRRTINPFLNADPGQRARRLARALVSDLVAYHPRKRDEGVAQGTLRQLFREEIKKSYEEYVEQVGKELAESTPHFQEALNDILAGGQRLF